MAIPIPTFWMDWSKDAETSESRPAALPSMAARYVQYRLTLRQNPGDASRSGWTTPNCITSSATLRRACRRLRSAEAAGPAHSGGGGGEGGKPAALRRAGLCRPASGRGDSQPRGVGREIRSNSDDAEHQLAPPAIPTTISCVIPLLSRPRRAGMEADRGQADGQFHAAERGGGGRRPLSLPHRGQRRAEQPARRGLDAEKISDEVVIDNTPPRFEQPAIKTGGDRARMTFGVSDELSLIAEVKVDIDNGDPIRCCRPGDHGPATRGVRLADAAAESRRTCGHVQRHGLARQHGDPKNPFQNPLIKE